MDFLRSTNAAYFADVIEANVTFVSDKVAYTDQANTDAAADFATTLSDNFAVANDTEFF